jgi:hypothetical protein
MKILAEHDGLRLVKTDGPNAYLVVQDVAHGTEITSTPCVTTEPKDHIIRLLLLERSRLAGLLAAPGPAAERASEE